jgi:pimeloyl-ACP methyl ester carboxylesterase
VSHDAVGAVMSVLMLGDIRLACTQAGAGAPSVLFLHGAMGERSHWQPVMERLQTRFAVCAYDQRCHGESVAPVSTCTVEAMAADVRGVIEALDLGPTIVVGHSFGARCALQAAADGTPNIAGIVLVDCSRTVVPRKSDGELPRADEIFGDELAAFVRRRFDSMFFANADSAMKAHVIAAAAGMDRRAAAALADSGATWDETGIETALARLAARVPTLPVMAVQSTFHDATTPRVPLSPQTTSTPWLDFLRGFLPQLDVTIVPNTGHYVMLEAPDEVAAAITRFAV